MLRSDRGGEYETPIVDVYAQREIIHETTTPCSPQSNRVYEKKNCTLKEMINAMLISFAHHKTCGEKPLCLPITFSIRYLKRKQRRLHMSYGEDDNHSINTCECGDV